jgi:hypothetical protein
LRRIEAEAVERAVMMALPPASNEKIAVARSVLFVFLGMVFLLI